MTCRGLYAGIYLEANDISSVRKHGNVQRQKETAHFESCVHTVNMLSPHWDYLTGGGN